MRFPLGPVGTAGPPTGTLPVVYVYGARFKEKRSFGYVFSPSFPHDLSRVVFYLYFFSLLARPNRLRTRSPGAHQSCYLHCPSPTKRKPVRAVLWLGDVVNVPRIYIIDQPFSTRGTHTTGGTQNHFWRYAGL